MMTFNYNGTKTQLTLEKGETQAILQYVYWLYKEITGNCDFLWKTDVHKDKMGNISFLFDEGWALFLIPIDGERHTYDVNRKDFLELLKDGYVG